MKIIFWILLILLAIFFGSCAALKERLEEDEFSPPIENPLWQDQELEEPVHIYEI